MPINKFDVAEVRRAALAAYDQGLCPLPPRLDGSKAPIGDWGRYQRVRPTRQQIEAWYGSYTGVGVVCGEISGDLECLEFDDPTVYQAYKALAEETGLDDLVQRIEAGYLEQSPSGGFHWLYRCFAISGNTKLARRPKTSDEMGHPHDKVKTLIEVRGEGGYIIIAPSYGKVHPSGRPYVLLRGGMESIVTITPDDREALFELARIFDLMPKPKVDGPSMPTNGAPGCRPGDRFNTQGEWEHILEPYGWQKVFDRGGVGYWRRPGKDQGISATTNWENTGLLYVFSTSTAFKPERAYSKFAAFAQLVHGGDYKAAARELAQMGYGAPEGSTRI